MEFQFTWQVDEMIILQPIGEITVDRGEGYVVAIWRPRPNELTDGPGREDALCRVHTQRNLSGEATATLENVDANLAEVAFESFEIDVQKELSALQRDMAAVAGDIVDLVRWKLGVWGRHSPLVYRYFECKIEGGAWTRLTRQVIPRYRFNSPRTIAPEFIQEIQADLNKEKLAPIAHSLLREARDQWPGDLRSSLILAIAAIEVGIKQCLVSLDSGQERTLFGKSAPETMTLLTTSLSKAIEKACPEKLVYRVPKSICDEIGRAIQYRNLVIHRPRRMTDSDYLSAISVLSPAWMNEFLITCLDLLWLFDYLTGNDFAIGRIAYGTQTALRNENGNGRLPHLGTAVDRLNIGPGELDEAAIQRLKSMSASYQRIKEGPKPSE